jgi:hypothetical protein
VTEEGKLPIAYDNGSEEEDTYIVQTLERG